MPSTATLRSRHTQAPRLFRGLSLLLLGTRLLQAQVDGTLQVDRVVLAFPNVAAGGEARGVVRVRNRGPREFKVQATVIPDPGAFQVSPREALVAGGGQSEITVTFRPSAAGAYSGQLVLTTGGDAGATARVALGGGARTNDDSVLRFERLQLQPQSRSEYVLTGQPGCIHGDPRDYRLQLTTAASAPVSRIPKPITVADDGSFRVTLDVRGNETPLLELLDLDGATVAALPLLELPTGQLWRDRIQVHAVHPDSVRVRGLAESFSCLGECPRILVCNTARNTVVEAQVQADNHGFVAAVPAAPGDLLTVVALGAGRELHSLTLAPVLPVLQRSDNTWTLSGEPGAEYALYLPAGATARAGITGRLDAKGHAQITRPRGLSEAEWKRITPYVLVTPLDGRPVRAALLP